MEAASIPEQPSAAPPRRALGKILSDNILWILMGIALLIFFFKDPQQTFDDVKTGLSNGTIWALIALGYTLVYGIIELINFAHGDVFMLGSMIALFLIVQVFGISAATPPLLLVFVLLLVILITMVVTAALNVSIERVAYRPLRNAPKLAPLISAIGMSFVLQNVALLIAGPANKSVDNLLPTVNLLSYVGVNTVELSFRQVFVGVVTIPLLVGMSWFVAKTKQGRAMRATAQDPDTAGLMGVDVNRTIALTFLLGGALAGAAGVVQILYNNVTVWNLGFRFGLNAFTSAVLGGIGNLPGAVLGALVLGQINAFSDRYVAANWTNAIVFMVLIGVLVFKPTGLLGQQLADRA
jgi:branched-chain amino acid transport system permease protein